LTAATPGADLTAGSQRTVEALRGALGLPDAAAARQEKRDRAFERLVQRPPQRYRTFGEQMDHGESTRERAERHRASVTPRTATAVGWDDGCHLPGELTGLSYY
jgi:hypothetical protein